MCSMLFILNVFDKLVPGNVYNKLLYIFIGCFLSSSALSLCLNEFLFRDHKSGFRNWMSGYCLFEVFWQSYWVSTNVKLLVA